MPFRVFIVEDHPTMQAAYTLLIEHEPDLYLCGTADSGEAALPAIRQSTPEIVIVDVSLPGMSGIEVVERLRAEQPHLPAIVISGHDETLFAKQALDAGAKAYLNKLDLPARLTETIKKVLRETPPQERPA